MKRYKHNKNIISNILIIFLMSVLFILIVIYFNKDKIFISNLTTNDEEVKDPVI